MKTRFIVLALVRGGGGGAWRGCRHEQRSRATCGPTGHLCHRTGTRSARQAFTAAALSPAEGHAIFAYVAIAVYDSVMAVKGGYRAVRGRRRRARGYVGRGGRGRGCPHAFSFTTCRLRRPTILDPAYAASLATIPDGQAKTDGVAVGEGIAALRHRCARRRRLPGTGDLHAAEPTDPRRLAPDGAHAADRHLPRADAAVQPRFRRPVPA